MKGIYRVFVKIKLLESSLSQNVFKQTFLVYRVLPCYPSNTAGMCNLLATTHLAVAVRETGDNSGAERRDTVGQQTFSNLTHTRSDVISLHGEVYAERSCITEPHAITSTVCVIKSLGL